MEQQRLSTEDVFSTSFGLLSAQIGPLVTIVGVAMAPAFLLTYLGGLGSGFSALMLQMLGSLIGIPLAYIAIAAVVFAAYRHLKGQPVQAGEALRKGLARFLPVFIAAVIVGVLTVIGLILLIIPGLIVLVLFAVAIPAVVAEGTGPIDGMQRSLELTQGNRLTVFFVILGVFVLNFAVTLLNGALSAVLPGFITGLITIALQLLTTSVFATFTAVLYFRLREAKEGVGVDAVAEIFD